MISKHSCKVLAQIDDGEEVVCDTIEKMVSGDIAYLIEELTQEIIDSVDRDTVYADRLIKMIEVTGIGYDCDGNYIIFESRFDGAHNFYLGLRNTSLPNLDYDSFTIVKRRRGSSNESSAVSFGTKIPDALVALRYLIERHYVRNIKNKH